MTRAEKASIAYQLVAHGPRVLGGSNILSEDDYKFWNINYDFKAGYEQAEEDLGWISVKDRLPEKRGYYFTCSDDNGYPQCIGVTLFDVAANEWYDDDDTYINIDYWMEVPQIIKK